MPDSSLPEVAEFRLELPAGYECWEPRRFVRLLAAAAPTLGNSVVAGTTLVVAIGLPIHEGYGMTETTAFASVQPYGKLRFGTIGKPLPGVEVKIADDGEISPVAPAS